MTTIELSIIDRATQLQHLSIEEQLSRLRFAETRAELDAHRRLAADLIRGLSILAASSCGDKMPRGADLPCKPTVGAVSDLPVNARPVAMDAEPVAPVSPLNGPQIPASGVSGGKVAQQPSAPVRTKVAGISINPNSGVRQAYPRGRW